MLQMNQINIYVSSIYILNKQHCCCNKGFGGRERGYKLTKRGFIRTLLLVLSFIDYISIAYVASFYRESALSGAT